LRVSGIDSRLVTAKGLKFRIASQLDRQMWRLQRSPVATWRSPARFSSLTATEINASSADVVNLHWVTDGFLSIEEIGKITKPLVWSMYDMWPFCGTEHYGVDSPQARWRTGYTHDNRPVEESGTDIDRWTWQRKSSQWAPMQMIPASSWLESAVLASALMGKWPVTRIPHVVDTDTFAPMDRQEARRQAGLADTDRVILFLASAGIRDSRKGFDLLERGLNRVKELHPNARLVVAGPAPVNDVPTTNMPITWFGNVPGNEQLRALYCSADLLAVPSREDNMPLTAMEAQSCGIPVVAFDVGGLPDIVVDEQTGLLVKPGETEAFAESILRLLEDAELRTDLGNQARQRSTETWSPTVIARAYLQLYERLMV